MKRLALGACAAALLAVSACMLPPFDVQVSRAFAAARKMEQVAAIGPLDIWRRLATGREVYFLPSRALGPPHGLLMVADSYGGSLRHVGLDPFGEPWITLEQSFVAIAAGDRLGFAVHMLKDPSAAGDRFILLAPGTDREYVRFSYDPLTGMINHMGLVSWTDLGGGSAGELVGVSFLPRDDLSIDEMSLLAHTGSGDHVEHELVVDAGVTAGALQSGKDLSCFP